MKIFSLLMIAILSISGFAATQTSQKIALRNNQEKDIIGSKLFIKFVSVIEDSRCPVGATCVWAGNAKVQIQIGKKGGEIKNFVLNTGLDPKTIVYKGYEIRIESLSPRPGENVKAMASNKNAVFVITKVKR